MSSKDIYGSLMWWRSGTCLPQPKQAITAITTYYVFLKRLRPCCPVHSRPNSHWLEQMPVSWSYPPSLKHGNNTSFTRVYAPNYWGNWPWYRSFSRRSSSSKEVAWTWCCICHFWIQPRKWPEKWTGGRELENGYHAPYTTLGVLSPFWFAGFG